MNQLWMEHRILIETIYMLLMVGTSAFVAYRAGSLYRLSGHTGLRWFRNAFVFFGSGFFLRFFLWVAFSPWVMVAMGYFLLMGSFFLLQSQSKRVTVHFMHPVAILLPFLDMILGIDLFLYLPVIGLFTYGIITSWRKYTASRAGQLYFITMVLLFLAWTVNYIGDLLQGRFPSILFYVYVASVTINMLFAFGVSRRRL